MAKILVFIDASTYAQSVCDHAAWVAKRMSASVDVIHVLGRRDVSAVDMDLTGALDPDARNSLLAELAAADEQKAKAAQKKGRLILEQAKRRLEENGIAGVSAKLRIGDLVETAQEFERDADLIVIGKRGEAADFAKLHLGSNLERVVRASKRPVLVASRAFSPIRRLLIAFDGGPSVTRAVEYLARAHTLFEGLEIRLLMVGARTEESAMRVQRATAMLSDAGYQVQASIEPGQPEATIATAVEREHIDLLVMGAYGHSRIRNLIIGSTTTEMIRSCAVPVVLFR